YRQAQQEGCRLSVPESTKACVRRVMQDSNASYRRDGLLEEFETFADEIAVLVRQPCDLSTRARQTGNQPEANRVGIGDKDDGDRAARFPGSIDLRGLATMHYKDIDLKTDQFLRQGGVPFQPSPDMSLLDDNGFSLHIPEIAQSVTEPSPPGRVVVGRIRRKETQPPTFAASCPSVVSGARITLTVR